MANARKCKWYPEKLQPPPSQQTVTGSYTRDQWDLVLTALANYMRDVREDYEDEPAHRDPELARVRLLMGSISTLLEE